MDGRLLALGVLAGVAAASGVRGSRARLLPERAVGHWIWIPDRLAEQVEMAIGSPYVPGAFETGLGMYEVLGGTLAMSTTKNAYGEMILLVAFAVDGEIPKVNLWTDLLGEHRIGSETVWVGLESERPFGPQKSRGE